MASHDNPWSDEASRNPQGNQNPNPYSTYQDQTQSRNPYAQDQSHGGGYAPPSGPPPHQQPLSSHPPGQQRYYSGQDEAGWAEGQSYQPPQHQSQPHTQPGYHEDFTYTPNHQQGSAQQHTPSSEVPPGLPPRRSATDLALPTGQDRSHQIEVMQSYEAAGRKDEHDQNVETLQREFPKIDGSLIAAIYGDSQSLSATREMLGEL
ncbi:hypothetical protein DE146DRAFT_758023 [Phaeosphaeria sp. MPI-PUGE-AT-0046c]|nr:hypothetical protein DE146DRAFT_758023 [Phaeosphaeria sp. MPI-PUGE-AT-0046c]